MNTLNFIQAGGFPMDVNVLDQMQTAYKLFNGLGQLAGDLSIIKGCTIAGNTVSDGVVYINGEVLEFRSGFIDTNVIIVQEVQNKVFENGSNNEVHYTRYVTFGTAATSWLWNDFKRVDSLRNIQSRILPPGTNPQLYCGSVAAIPLGWKLCDGSHGTPNLSGQFIVGYDPNDEDYNAIGNSGGAKEVSLSPDQNAPHGHTVNDPGHTHSFVRNYGEVRGGKSDGTTAPRDGGSTLALNKAYTGISINSSGLGHPHENRPNYYTLAYIIYIG